ncbi:MAG: NUDIX domain-containing protein [bacterium]|nr:NUDIX domain-containing protein [bacterium]
MIKLFISVGALILKGDQVLLHHRTDYDLWDLPSGSMEKDETIIQTLKREIKEETGLIVKPVRLIGVYHNYLRGAINFHFLVKVISGKLTLNKEADEFGYFDYKKLPTNLAPKQKERILDYFKDKKSVTVKTQKSQSSIKVLRLKKKK